MSYKNSIKLLSSNFNVVWKQLFYILIFGIISILITYASATPIINLLDEHGVLAEIGEIFQTIYTSPKDVVTAISSTFLHFANVVTTNFGKIWYSVVITNMFAVGLSSILKEVSTYNLFSLMHMKLTSFVDIGYTRNLISTLGQSLRFSLVKILYKIPTAMIKMTILYLYFKLINGPFSIIFGLSIVSMLLILLSSAEITFFAGMAPKMLSRGGNCSAFKAFFSGFKTISKTFGRTFAGAIIVTLTLVLINVFLGLFTIGAGLLITVPASMLFIVLFELTSYFGATGERYYLSSTIIATPLKDTEENIKN